MDLISIETVQDAARVEQIVQAFATYQEEHKEVYLVPAQTVVVRPNDAALTKTVSHSPFYILRRFAALLRRSWRQNIRNTYIHWFRLGASAVNAVLLAAIFPSVAPGRPPSPASVADRVALLSFGAINMCFIAFMKVRTRML